MKTAVSILSAFMMLAGCTDSPRGDDISLSSWSRKLENLGWSFERESRPGSSVRIVEYRKRDSITGDRLLCEIVAMEGGIDSLSVCVFRIERTEKAVIAARRMLDTVTALLPSSGEALVRAVDDSRSAGGPNEGVRRTEGSATTGDGWRVTVVEYLEAFADAPEKPWLLISAEKLD